MIASEVREMLSFIDGNPTAYHTTAAVRDILLKAGFAELLESRKWALEPGKDYFVCRNGSSILAFRMGEQLENYSFNVAAAHTDSPCFRIKENAEIHMGRKYTKLNTEGYGGMICSTWMDRPLSVAGRVLIKENDAITSRLLTLDRDLLMIPSVAIHMNREVNDKASFNKQVDMLPVLGGACEEGALKKLIAEELKVSEEQILGSDLFLYVREKATVWGCNEEFISCGRLDDQQCVYGILKGLLTAKNARSIGVAAFFDNEEVGSGTKQGAASTFLYDVLHRIAQSLGGNDEDFHRAVASSFMVSADNAHAVHPNHPEHTDVNNCTYMNKGVVIKTHAGQKYTSDGMSVAAARELAARAGVPLQYFANRSDKVGGSTLGNLAMAQVRYSIIDLTAHGHQPMWSACGRYCITFNGEIYNYQSLREDLLKAGHVFTTKTDSEVLLHGFEEYGTDLLNKLRGMFAFIIWDKNTKTLFGARDYFGIKPFYYAKMQGTLMFGSEIKSFVEHPHFKRELNERALEGYLSFQYSPGYETFFKNVYKLPPAHYFFYKDGKMDMQRYWIPEFNAEEDKPLEYWVDEIEKTFDFAAYSAGVALKEFGRCIKEAFGGTDKEVDDVCDSEH